MGKQSASRPNDSGSRPGFCIFIDTLCEGHTPSVRGEGVAPITAARTALGVTGFMKAALGLRLTAGFFGAAFLAAGFLAAGFLAAGFLAAGFFAAGFFAAGFFAAGFLAAGFFAAGFFAAGFFAAM